MRERPCGCKVSGAFICRLPTDLFLMPSASFSLHLLFLPFIFFLLVYSLHTVILLLLHLSLAACSDLCFQPMAGRSDAVSPLLFRFFYFLFFYFSLYLTFNWGKSRQEMRLLVFRITFFHQRQEEGVWTSAQIRLLTSLMQLLKLLMQH